MLNIRARKGFRCSCMIPLQIGHFSLLSGKFSGNECKSNKDTSQRKLYFSNKTTIGDQRGLIRDRHLAAFRFSQSSTFKIYGKYTAMVV
jgi:hypothetical protein